MASSARTVEFLLEQIAGAGAVSARKMFGEYAVYCGGVVVGLVCDDEFFLKPTDAGRECLAQQGPGHVIDAAPYPGARPHLRIGAQHWEDPELMVRLIRITLRALPVARPRPVKKKSVGKVEAGGNAKRRTTGAKPAKAKVKVKAKASPAPGRSR